MSFNFPKILSKTQNHLLVYPVFTTKGNLTDFDTSQLETRFYKRGASINHRSVDYILHPMHPTHGVKSLACVLFSMSSQVHWSRDFESCECIDWLIGPEGEALTKMDIDLTFDQLSSLIDFVNGDRLAFLVFELGE